MNTISKITPALLADLRNLSADSAIFSTTVRGEDAFFGVNPFAKVWHFWRVNTYGSAQNTAAKMHKALAEGKGMALGDDDTFDYNFSKEDQGVLLYVDGVDMHRTTVEEPAEETFRVV